MCGLFLRSNACAQRTHLNFALLICHDTVSTVNNLHGLDLMLLAIGEVVS